MQAPLGFSVRGRQARGGLYVIGRAFDGLEIGKRRPADDRASRAIETGLSFSTAPDLRIWEFPLRWLAAGYQFGRISGVRMYVTFPF